MHKKLLTLKNLLLVLNGIKSFSGGLWTLRKIIKKFSYYMEEVIKNFHCKVRHPRKKIKKEGKKEIFWDPSKARSWINYQ